MCATGWQEKPTDKCDRWKGKTTAFCAIPTANSENKIRYNTDRKLCATQSAQVAKIERQQLVRTIWSGQITALGARQKHCNHKNKEKNNTYRH